MMEILLQTGDLASTLLLTLFYSIWTGAILYMVLRAIHLLLRDEYSGTRYYLSISTLLLYFILTVCLFLLLYRPEMAGPIKMEQVDNYPGSLMPEITNRVPQAGNLVPLALKLYFFGILFFTLRFIFSLIQLNSVVRYGSPAEPTLAELLKQARQKLRIRKNVRLRVSKRVGSPALFGFFRPVIIVPAGMLTHLSFAEAEVILMHELIHLKRMDFLVTLIQHLLEIIFFFNPFVWLISKTISIEREKFCDDKVIGFSNARTIYARALCNLSLLQGNLSPVAPAATGDNKHHLLTRIQRILKIKVMKKIHVRHFYITAFAIIGVVAVTTFSGFTTSLFSIDKRNQSEPVKQAGITNNHGRHITQQPGNKV